MVRLVPVLATATGSTVVAPIIPASVQIPDGPIPVPQRLYFLPRVSPDGTRIAVDIRDEDEDIWIWDIARRALTRFTFDPASDQYPVWTPDGRRLAFASRRAGPASLFWQAADGTGAPERLTSRPDAAAPHSFSPDARQLAFQEYSPTAGSDLHVLALDGKRASQPLLATPFAEQAGEISPDGRWIAYESDESGRQEIYVRPFPDVERGRWQVSSGGGSRPVWARSGRELFYMSGPVASAMIRDERSGFPAAIVVVPVQTTPSFAAGNPVAF